MSKDLREQIFENLDYRDTDELLEIWQANDHVEWSEIAFEVIQEILQQRLGEVPSQAEPVYKHTETKADDPDNSPVFYKPRVVLQLGNWLRWAAIASVVISAVSNILRFPTILQNYLYLQIYTFNFVPYLITLVLVCADVAITFVILYLPLRALAQILNILMEMEFNSRGVK